MSRAGRWRFLAYGLAVVLVLGHEARGQAASEYGGAVAGMGAVGTKAGSVGKIIPVPASQAKQTPPSAHIPVQDEAAAVSGEDANRKALEDQAGPDAGKVLLRSKPVKASVWIGGKRIGNTPLLLLLAPGAYRVELRGDRGELAEQRVDLQPKESREIVVTMQPRYPSLVRLPQPAPVAVPASGR